jgi:ABC-type nitrate/sulfonate/bicarbonate transport system substrate-binding protein
VAANHPDRLHIAAVSRNYFNMPLWVGERRGFFAAEGIDLRSELHEGVDEVTNRLRDGRVQFAYGITEHVVLDREAGGQQVIVGGNVNRLPFSLIAGKSLRSVEGLRGKVIGVSSIEAGSSSLVMKLLEARGLHYPGDYDIRAVGPILARWEKLQSGEIDAGLQGAPLNYIALDQGYPSLCEPRAEVPFFQFTSLNVLEPWAATHQDLMLRFMRAFVRAHRWFFAHREEANAIAEIECRIAPAYANRAWLEYTQEEIFPPGGDVLTASVQALIDISALIRALPNRQNRAAESYIDRSYLHAAWQSLGPA